ncbi:hypothetical protein B0H14DRAFT_2714308 [Mycena olivaceomarginata]|nr:hypothetical protein B0H14DRAFT_2714308 [Mycena olivaceomarginata]
MVLTRNSTPRSKRYARRAFGPPATIKPTATTAIIKTALSQGRQRIPRPSDAEMNQRYRQCIADVWNRIAHEAGVPQSAKITFVNEIDDEAVPPGVNGLFTYLERDYIYDVEIPRPVTPGEAQAYPCGVKTNDAPYTSQGLFKFDTNSKIIECTESCSCRSRCINRVTQCPRQIPIEIFKTAKRGWGVRTAEALVRGQVLGIYTGSRKNAGKLLGERAAYIFQLDMDEDPNDTPTTAYSIDAFQCGKTAQQKLHSSQLNACSHSCGANTRIIAVAHGPVAVNGGLPYYLAFVAAENIAPATELTLDYGPAEQSAWASKKYREKSRSKKLKRRKNQPPCQCGASQCRGWLPLMS